MWHVPCSLGRMRRSLSICSAALVLGLLALTSRADAQSSPDAPAPDAPPSPASETAPAGEEPPEPPDTGVVLVDENRRAVIVDGVYQRVDGGAVTVTCGKHRILQRDDLFLQDEDPRNQRAISAALRKAKPVDVPCGGNISIRHAKSSFAGRAHGGVGQRTLFKSSVLGAELAASIGVHVRDIVDVYFLEVQVLFASTSVGLPVREYRVGASADFEPFTRVHFGVGTSLGAIEVTRATNGHTLGVISAGARLFASVDVWRIGDRAGFYLLGQLSLDSVGGVPATSIWGPTAAIGARF